MRLLFSDKVLDSYRMGIFCIENKGIMGLYYNFLRYFDFLVGEIIFVRIFI